MKQLIKAVMLLLCLSTILTSCGSNKKSNLEGYEWLEGRWSFYDMEYRGLICDINITPKYIQYRYEFPEEFVPVDYSTLEKIPYSIQIIRTEFNGDLKAICKSDKNGEPKPIYYINEKDKCPYFFWDFDQEMDLERVQ